MSATHARHQYAGNASSAALPKGQRSGATEGRTRDATSCEYTDFIDGCQQSVLTKLLFTLIMDFGRLDNVDGVKFKLPPDHPMTASVLGGKQRKQTQIFVGCPAWSEPKL